MKHKKKIYEIKNSNIILNTKIPIFYVIIYAITLIILGLLAVLVQIYLILLNIKVTYYASGIWCGICIIIAGCLIIFMSKY